MAKRDLSRRDFLKLSAVAAAAGIVAPRILAAEGQDEAKKPALEYRVLGRTGLKPTTVSIGCMISPEPVIAKAFDLGINWFDTANSYVYKGENCERAVGRVLKGKRDRAYICTKATPGTTQQMLAKLDTSLQRLETDHVDLWLAHGISNADQLKNENTVAALQRGKEQGKTRFIGVSAHSNMDVVINGAVDGKIYDAVLAQYNFQCHPSVKAAIARAKAAGVGIIAMKTQAAVAQMMNEYEKKKATDPNTPMPTVPGAVEGQSLYEAALKWVLADENVTCAVPGMQEFAHLEMYFPLMGKRLGYLDKRRLERYADGFALAYCAGCNGCAGTCPRGVSIPDVRRCAMYLDAYRDEALARESYREIQANAAPCADCSACSARCVRQVALHPILKETHSRLA